MSISLKVPLEALERGPFQLEGVLPGTVLDLEREVSIRNVGEVSYDLKAERTGGEVLVTGRVEAPMELECVRSGRFFSTTVRDSAFLRDYSTEELGDELDLTDDVREAVVIQIPGYPVSPEAQAPDFVLPRLPKELTGDAKDGDGGGSPWNQLDRLNL